MKCPNCDADLMMTERSSIEIDYCPKCRGIWLDRGELDKIIERSNKDINDRYDEQSQGDSYNKKDKHYKKPKNILGELFDF